MMHIGKRYEVEIEILYFENSKINIEIVSLKEVMQGTTIFKYELHIDRPTEKLRR